MDVAVSAPAGCVWNAVSEVAWIHIVSGTSGTGPGITRITVDTNSSRMLRMGAVRLGAAAYLVVQSGY
jgi:hypothetical protein